ncbi:hypothetical protein B0J15DRAFT_461223 [Fusarium solani]|uniref:Uncharacterized protein n=1 Tax=Fusarium solani TaxID=169388 RepID=A0A9P9KZD6_FUSSL|nr:uncharacterized protein B0J15DRAFT_461223 [Fusarium solani]KAH7271174.1 hypothetical protein B0J15DRAFT_461223 [Fusarium solani]
MPGFLPARDRPAPLPTIPQAQDPEALARNSKARRGGADTGTIEDTRLYSVWDEWRKRRVDRAGVPGWKAWAGTEDKGSEVTMTSVSETITTTNCPVVRGLWPIIHGPWVKWDQSQQDSLESSGAWGRWDGGFVHHGDSGWIMKNERDWSRLNYGGVDGLHKARRSSRSTAQRMVSCCFLPLRNAGRTAHATTISKGKPVPPREPDIGCISETWHAGIVVCLKTCPALCCSRRSTSHGTTASTSHTLAAVGWGLGAWVLPGTWKSESTTARKGQGRVRAGEA